MKLWSLFSFICLYAIVQGGRILNGDLWTDYVNAGSMTELSFTFMLENSIDEYDYIKVALPFPLHATLTPAYPATEGLSLPSGLTVTYQYVDGSSNIQPTVYTCQALTETIDSSTYFIRFYNTDRKTIVSIPKNQWFYLKFKVEESLPLSYQQSNTILQIQMSTVSSVWTNAMVYDDNLAFNYFLLESAPTQGINLAVTPYNFGSSAGYLLTEAEYEVYLDVDMAIPTYQFQQNLKLVFLISQKDTFTWNGTCQSVAKTQTPTIPILDAALYTCSIDKVKNTMEVILTPQALATQTSYRFTVGMVNPAIVVTGVNVEVRAVKEQSGVILSDGEDTSALNTNQIYITYQEIFLGWGLRPDPLLPFGARVFRGDDATPNYMPYNSLSLKFSVSQDTSSSVQLRIVINIPSESNAEILPNGYTTNLPSFTNKQIQCLVQNKDDTELRSISCTGVGSLVAGTVYQIGWKMFFPYDNYQSDIDCTQFGLITIYTTELISQDDNTFIIGRGDEFLRFMKNSPDYFVIGRNQSYIQYMKTFANLNLIVLSSDFQEFLQRPEEIIVTNRPPTYMDKQFNDVYVVGGNLAFLTYLGLFDDLYIAYRLKSDSDIAKGYHDTPLVASSMPKNTLNIQTANSMNWADYVTNQNPIVSSTTATSGNTPGDGLRVEAATNQSLIFTFAAPYAEVTSYSSTAGTVINNNWSFHILMNPKIQLTDTPVLSESSTSLSVEGRTVNSASDFNKYTLLTLKGSISDELQVTFPTSQTKRAFGIYPFLIEDFSSIYSDDNNFDIMMASIDGIDGPKNKLIYNGFFLINAFTMMNDATLGTLNLGYVAYAHSIQMDGSKVPTLIRAKGSVAGSSNFHSLAIFFDKLTPFFSNYHNGDIYCHSTDGSPYCKFQKGAEDNAIIYNYQTLSRIQIPVTTPTSAFDILIPITAQQGKVNTYFYLGYIEMDPVTGKKSLAYIQPARIITHSGSYSTNGLYGPTLSGKKVGETIPDMELNARSPSGVTVNSGDNLGAAFLYFSEWDFIGSSTIDGWSSNGECYQMGYLLYQTNYDDYLLGSSFTYTYKDMKGLVCFADIGNTVTTAVLTISEGYLPAKWGHVLPGWGGYSHNTGNLFSLEDNQYEITTVLTIDDVDTIGTPTMGPMLIKSVGTWVIPLPVPIDDDVEIIITGDSGSTNLPFTASGTCCVYVGDTKLPVGCIFTSSPTEVDYILTVPQPDLLPASTDMKIVHYGLTTNSTYNTVNFDLVCYSLVYTTTPNADDVIFEASAVPFNYEGDDDSYLGESQISLNQFVQNINNKAAITQFEFNFNVLSKGLYETNRVRINLGQFHTDNEESLVSPKCRIYEYDPEGSTELSHDWAAVDTSQGLNKLQFWPDLNLLSTNLTYNVKCSNFIAASSPSPTGISAMIVNTSEVLSGEITTSADIDLEVLSAMSASNTMSVSKKYTIPSSLMEMEFSVLSPGITTDSIMYLGFPSYYANGLGPDVKCYASTEIFCTVRDRILTIKYLGDYAAGVSFTLTVAGVTKPISYNSGTFYFVIDNDDDPTNVLSSSTFTDSVSSSILDTQNFPVFQILQFEQSSAYLREEGVSITMDFYLTSTMPSISVGQQLFLVFPPIFGDVLRFISPTCTLNIRGNTLKNYISSCSVTGLRLKMPFLDDIILGNVYTLTVDGIINPTNPSSNTYKYTLEITTSDDSTILAKAFSPHINYQMPVFVVNPIRKSLNYYTIDDGLVTEVTTTANIQSQQIYISSGPDLTTSAYDRNVYLSPTNNLYSIPSSLALNAGSNPFPIRLSALSSGVTYVYFEKTGDGSYYSQLPPLILNTNKNYFTPLSLVESSFNIPVDDVNTNYSLGLNLPSSLYLMSQVNFTVTLSNSVGIALRNNPTKIAFYPERISAEIELYVNDDTLWIPGETTNLIITPENTNTYAEGVTIPLVAVNPIASNPPNPSLTLRVSSTALKSATFSIKCSEYGRFVYHVSRKFDYNTSACTLSVDNMSYWISQSSLDGLRVDETYYECEDMMGMQNIKVPNSTQSLTISNLMTSTTYNIEGYCLSQIQTKSGKTTKSFTTNSNGGKISRINLYFPQPLTTSLKIKLVCALALFFNTNYYMVSTYDGYYCSELINSRRLQATTERILSAQYKEIVYFGVNRELNEDTTPDEVRSASINQTALRAELDVVVGLPTLQSIDVAEDAQVGSNDLTSSPYVDIGPTWVYVEGMKMSNNGLIYVIIGQADLWPRDPLLSQIKQGSGPDGLPPVFYRVLAYDTSDRSTGYVAYTGMDKQKKLKMYILCSDDNPFDDANFGDIRSYDIKAETAWQHYSIGLLLVMVMMLWM